jgi:hypothetical protein
VPTTLNCLFQHKHGQNYTADYTEYLLNEINILNFNRLQQVTTLMTWCQSAKDFYSLKISENINISFIQKQKREQRLPHKKSRLSNDKRLQLL